MRFRFGRFLCGLTILAGVVPAWVARAQKMEIAPVRFTAPMQPWTSPDGRVRLLRPALAQATASAAPLGTLMTASWRLIWAGEKTTPGHVVVRLVLKVTPPPSEKTATEVFQVGVSRDPGTVRSCLTYGLHGGSGRRQPDRVINGLRYAVWTNGDAGMSQRIAATDLRTVVAGACYAAERFSYAESASDGDPSVALPEARGAAELDATLASLSVGHAGPSGRPSPPVVRLPPGAVAR